VHCLAGLSCTDCHGGNPAAEDVTLAKNSGRPFLGRPKTTQIVSLCGACHSSHEYMHRYGPSLRTDQADEYMASRHGKLAAKDDPRVPTCVTCHAAHKTMRVGDPLSPVHPLRVADTCAHCHSDSQRMDGSRLPYNQMELYRSSRHAEALYRKGNLAAPTCNDCHGDHDELKPDTYATSHICGRCHTRERALIESNKHATYLTPQDRPNCGRCHENHAPDPPGLSLLHGASHACTSCHRDDVGAETVERLSLRAIELRERIGNARKFLTDAQNAGIDVRYSLGDLDRASALLLSLRTEIHTLDEARVGIPLKEGIDLADAAYREGVRALKTLQLRDRIQSLFVGVLAIVLIIGGVLYRRSILKRRAQEALLLQEQERIVLSRERLARIGQISAGVAHALRNPLHGVFNCVDLLSTRIPADESLQRILALMTDGLKRIQNVTQRLLVLTREAPLNKTMTNIRVLLEDAIHFMDAESQKKGVVLCLETQGEMAVPLDSNQMTEAILNLLDNALDATSVGGSIIVRAEHQSGNKERLQISIEDNGTGITERDLGEVFNAFFTTKPIGEGTGLGLAITKRIIEDHGGTISIRSLPEKGTCVSIDLPIE
jgi:signal transduction histidine kinase